ncbi:DinB family protein [Amycolatopsis taiwanensis]|uniref:DinB family protein n=1 Tax=Amycolatopsis taiwanensis TaxID=342230 RepID=UPI0004B971E1|nr:DinB family protein [Amycolatopsis taiwanensis]
MLIAKNVYLHFADQALDGMSAILRTLGDELANKRPDLPGANSPYAIVTHCLGVLNFWAGGLVAGREVVRDREAEFTASGPVEELVSRVEAAKLQFHEDVTTADPSAPLRKEPHPAYQDTPAGLTQGGALQHVYEELAQHHGQLEVTRDLLTANG